MAETGGSPSIATTTTKTGEREMTVTRKHNGSFVCSDIVNGYLVKQVYYGYSEKESEAEFRKYVRSLK